MVKNKDEVRCSFCGKNTNEVFKMIAETMYLYVMNALIYALIL